MAEYFPKFCRRCSGMTPHFRKTTNHILHLLLTIFTCGWWLPIWILLCVRIGGWKCSKCGKGGSGVLLLGIPLVLIGCCVMLPMIFGGRSQTPPTSLIPTTNEDTKANPIHTAKEEDPRGDSTKKKQDQANVGKIQKHAEEQKQVEAEKKEKIEKAKWRTWTAVDGAYTTEAKFIKAVGNIIYLEKKTGTIIQVQREKLCEDDWTWIKNRGWNKGIEP